MIPASHSLRRAVLFGIVLGTSTLTLRAQAPTADEVRELIGQNHKLIEQVKNQQAQIDELRRQVSELSDAQSRGESQIRELRDGMDSPSSAPRGFAAAAGRDLHISGEAGFAYFKGGPRSSNPAGSFRADDVKLFVETPVWKDTYFYGGIELVTREASDEYFHVGELYADFENVSGRLGGPDSLVNVRVGRFNIPFGEEYLRRGVMENPLVSHSLSDIWGIDEGLEIYGSSGRFSYVAAVQNGSHATLKDYDSDKAIVVRLGYDPTDWLHLSASAMRTGDLLIAKGELSEVWIGNEIFRSIGGSATTTKFNAKLYELDAALRWKRGSLSAAAGRAEYDDNDTAADNSRALDYFYVEGVQKLTDRLNAAVRYSRIDTDKGYPLVGQGDFVRYFFQSAPTDHLSRLSIGFNYRIADPLLFKVDYSIENGRLVTGESRDDEDMFSAELGLMF